MASNAFPTYYRPGRCLQTWAFCCEIFRCQPATIHKSTRAAGSVTRVADTYLSPTHILKLIVERASTPEGQHQDALS